MNASACQNSSPVATHNPAGIRQAIEPRIGPARPTRASAIAEPPSERVPTAAPRNGMNTIPLGLTPSRRSWM